MTDMSSHSLSAGTFTRRTLFLVAFLAALPFAASSPAAALNPAETFIDQNVQKGLAILSDQALPDTQRKAQFRTFLLSLVDLDRVAMFTLGSARRTATDAEKAQFRDAFRDFAVSIYESRLNAYSGQTLKVTGSQPTGRGDTIVKTVLVDPNSSSKQPLPVSFRVSNSDGKQVVIDVNVLGVWLAIEERDQFSSFLGDNGNRVTALIAHLKDLTRQMRAGAPLPGQK